MILPGATIGILGGGQLGRMLAIAAAQMGYGVHIYTPEANACALEVAAHSTIGAYEDTALLKQFAAEVDVITLEFENVPVAALEAISAITPAYPSAALLGVCQHRVKEKETLQALGIATAPFMGVTSLQALRTAVAEIGLPAVLKTCRFGYDGKGQAVIRNTADIDAAWAALSTDDAILEGFVDFVMEASVLVARNAHGEVACYPLVQNIHRDHILHQTIIPAPVNDGVAEKAEAMARRIAEKFDLIGLLAVEMFITASGEVLVNELAPRPHNSGHWSVDACVTSQFHQTIRAVSGLSLGDTHALCAAVMTNLIGDEVNDAEKWLQNPRVALHLYGKGEAREGRKMGHVTEMKPSV